MQLAAFLEDLETPTVLNSFEGQAVLPPVTFADIRMEAFLPLVTTVIPATLELASPENLKL